MALWCALILTATTVPIPSDGLPASGLRLDLVVHLALYTGLGWHVGEALVRTGRAGPVPMAAGWLAGLAFAALDEWHQTLLAGRTAAADDWIADALGLAVGLVALAAERRAGSGTARRGGRTGSTRSGTVDGSDHGTDAKGRKGSGRR